MALSNGEVNPIKKFREALFIYKTCRFDKKFVAAKVIKLFTAVSYKFS
jgi:hypothetical protein